MRQRMGIAGTALLLALYVQAATEGVMAQGNEVVPPALKELVGNRHLDGLPTNTLYNPAGVPLAHVQALNHAGTKISYAEFAAAGGWAFSFGYKYGNISPSCMTIPGPYDTFRWLTERLGYKQECVGVRDAARFQEFVRTHCAAGTPVLSDHFDGGILTGYRMQEGKFEVLFEGTVGAGWNARLEPASSVCVLKRVGEPPPPRELALEALRRAVVRATEVG